MLRGFCLALRSPCWGRGSWLFSFVRCVLSVTVCLPFPGSILHKSIAGRYRPVRVADGPITARYRFIKNTSWVPLGVINMLCLVTVALTRLHVSVFYKALVPNL